MSRSVKPGGANIMLDRIRRLYPAVYARYERGEFTSVYAAAVAAGAMRPQITIPRRPVRRLVGALRRNLNNDELREVRELLQD